MSGTPPRPSVSTRMPKGAKRPKASRACLACRKLKARCEPARDNTPDSNHDALANAPLYVCHRCKTLCLDCFYETAEGNVVTALPIPESTSSSASTENSAHKRKRAADSSSESSDPSGNSYVSIGAAPPLLIGRRPEMKPEAVEYLLNWFEVQDPLPPQRHAQISSFLCVGKRAAPILDRQSVVPPDPVDDLEYLKVALQPFEAQLYTLYIGVYSHYAPMLSIPVSSTGSLRSCRTPSEVFKLLAAYLVALPHLEDYPELNVCRKPLRRTVDAFLRRSLHSPWHEVDTIIALHCCATNLLYPVDGFAVDDRPSVVAREEDDGLLQFALDLNPRAALITATNIAHELGYHQDTQALRYFRASHEKALSLGHDMSHAQHVFQRAIERALLWIGLQQARNALDVAEDRLEWTSLQQFERQVPRIEAREVIEVLEPLPSFLTPRERSRCLWILKRAHLYELTLTMLDLRPSPGVLLERKYAEKRSTKSKDVFDEWRTTFQEEMRAPSLAFRNDDPNGLALHRFLTRFTTMENLALHSIVGHGYYREILKDFRKRSDEVLSPDGQIWKSAPAICCRQDDEPLFPAFLLNYSFSQNTSKFLGMSSVICPTTPQLYDFVSWEPTTSAEIPGPSLLALPTIEAGLFALPVLMSAEVRLPIIETWAHAAAHFNPFLLSLVSSYVKSLRSMHVSVDLPGVLKMRYSVPNATADLLQIPLEMLMRDMTAAERSLDDPLLESVLGSSFSVLKQFEQMGLNARKVRKDAPDVLYAVMDSGAPAKDVEANARRTDPTTAVDSDAEESGYDTIYDLSTQIFGRDSLKGDVRSRSTQNSTTDEGSPYSGRATSRAASVESPLTTQRSPRMSMLARNANDRSVAGSSAMPYQSLSPEMLVLPTSMPIPAPTMHANAAVAGVALQDELLNPPLPTPTSVYNSGSEPQHTPLDPTATFDFISTAYGTALQQERLNGVSPDSSQTRAEGWLAQEQSNVIRQPWSGGYSMQPNHSNNGSGNGGGSSNDSRIAYASSIEGYAESSTFGHRTLTESQVVYAASDFPPRDPHATQAAYHHSYQHRATGQEASDYPDGVVFNISSGLTRNATSQPTEQDVQQQQQPHQQQQHQQEPSAHNLHISGFQSLARQQLPQHLPEASQHPQAPPHSQLPSIPQTSLGQASLDGKAADAQPPPSQCHASQPTYSMQQPFLSHIPSAASLSQYTDFDAERQWTPRPNPKFP
ncbi:hypothetical protein ACQY0O_000277 [Thecaphora frezii]